MNAFLDSHWPYIVAAYAISLLLIAADWFAASIRLRRMINDFAMRKRRDAAKVNTNE